MKNKNISILFFLILILSSHTFLCGQVGINTDNPNATLHVDKDISASNTTPQGIIIPSFYSEEREKFVQPEKGLIIFNYTKNCLEINLGNSTTPSWKCVNELVDNNAQDVRIISSEFRGRYISNVKLNPNENVVVFKVLNNTFSDVVHDFENAVTIQDDGINNITIDGAQNTNITIPKGESIELVYKLNGTPKNGVLIANFKSINGLSNSVSVNISDYGSSLRLPTFYNIHSNSGMTNINNSQSIISYSIPYVNAYGTQPVYNTTCTSNPDLNGNSISLNLNIPETTYKVNNNDKGKELSFTVATNSTSDNHLIKFPGLGEIEEICRFKLDVGGNKGDIIIRSFGQLYNVSKVENSNVTNTGFNSAFILYPSNFHADRKMPAVVVMHGWMGSKEKMEWIGNLIASYGFAVIVPTETGSFDLVEGPPKWIERIQHAIDAIKLENQKTTSPIYNKIDLNNLSLVGHSMGGGGIFHYIDSSGSNDIRAVVSLAPFIGAGGVAGGDNRASTLILTGSEDFVAAPSMGENYYNTIPDNTIKDYLRIDNVGHNDFEKGGKHQDVIGKYIIDWLLSYSK